LHRVTAKGPRLFDVFAYNMYNVDGQRGMSVATSTLAGLLRDTGAAVPVSVGEYSAFSARWAALCPLPLPARPQLQMWSTPSWESAMRSKPEHISAIARNLSVVLGRHVGHLSFDASRPDDMLFITSGFELIMHLFHTAGPLRCRDFDKLGGANTADTPEWAARWAAITAVNLQVATAEPHAGSAAGSCAARARVTGVPALCGLSRRNLYVVVPSIMLNWAMYDSTGDGILRRCFKLRAALQVTCGTYAFTFGTNSEATKAPKSRIKKVPAALHVGLFRALSVSVVHNNTHSTAHTHDELDANACRACHNACKLSAPPCPPDPSIPDRRICCTGRRQRRPTGWGTPPSPPRPTACCSPTPWGARCAPGHAPCIWLRFAACT
jgi:hypothetical protein